MADENLQHSDGTDDLIAAFEQATGEALGQLAASIAPPAAP